MSVSKKTIIMVDDHLTNLTIGNNVLEENYNVITLSSGALLLRTLEKRIPDLILLDVDMPEMTGFDTIKLLKENSKYSSIPVIFLTAKSDGPSELEGLSLGAVDYIAKPFSPPLLLKRIELHLLVQAQKNDLEIFNQNLQEMVDEKTKTVTELQTTILSTMANLVENRDHATGGHIERTQSYLKILLSADIKNISYKNEIESWDIELLLQSAQLHDIGKISIDDNILRKPGKLTDEEFEHIKEHTVIGQKIIDGIRAKTSQKTFLEQARVLAMSHHEWWDGSGYPNGLKGEQIPLQGRLMAIADVYDALISDRPYKLAMAHEHAVDVIKSERGTHFDPVLVDLFLSVADEFNNAVLQKKEEYELEKSEVQ